MFVNKMNRNILLNLRIFVFSVQFVHLLIVAQYLLTLDFTRADDPRVWKLGRLKWRMITAWFNLAYIVYLPVCIYCDRRKLRENADTILYKFLDTFRYYCFTSILFPATAQADILFWRLWHKNRELLAPLSVDQVVPYWAHHSTHTVSLIVAIFDLIFVPRTRPKNHIIGLTIMSLFFTIYSSVCIRSIAEGDYIYSFWENFTICQFILLIIQAYSEYCFYYTSQWLVADVIWGKTSKQTLHKVS